MNLQSLLGYAYGSPFSSHPYLDIQTPEGLITMENTPIDLLGIDNMGNAKVMKAGRKNPYKFKGSMVREIPMQQGGQILPPMAGGPSSGTGTVTLYQPRDTIKTIKLGDNTVREGDIKRIASHAKAMGLDPYSVVAIGMRETNLNEPSSDFGRVQDYYPNVPSSVPDEDINVFYLAKTFRDRMRQADQLAKAGKIPDTEEARLQYYDTSHDGTYGKSVLSIRENLLRKNPDVRKAVEQAEAQVYKSGKFLIDPSKLQKGGSTPYDLTKGSQEVRKALKRYEAISNDVQGDVNRAVKYQDEINRLESLFDKHGVPKVVSDDGNMVHRDFEEYFITQKRYVPQERNLPNTNVQGTGMTTLGMIQAPTRATNVSPRRTNYSATVRDENSPSKQRVIYFNTRDEWRNFLDSGAVSPISTQERADSGSAATYRTMKKGGKTKKRPMRGNPYQKGGYTPKQLFDFIFDDEEVEGATKGAIPNAPSVEQVDTQVALNDLDVQRRMLQSQENDMLAMEAGMGNPYNQQGYTGDIMSSGQYGAQNVGQMGRQIYGQLASDLGYLPVANSIYRSKEQNDSLIAAGAPAAKNSWHLTGNAIDIKPTDWHRLSDEQQQFYRANYDVVYHNNHYHIEPK